MTTSALDDGLQSQPFPPAGVRLDDPRTLRLFYHPPGVLRLTVDEYISFSSVRLFQASPLSHPGRYLSLQNGKGDEIALVDRLEDLTAESRAVAEEEIARRYLTAIIESVPALRSEFGITYWSVLTNRGPREFVVQNLSESCIWLSDSHVLLVDVDGTRFEIPDLDLLDAPSRSRVDGVL